MKRKIIKITDGKTLENIDIFSIDKNIERNLTCRIDRISIISILLKGFLEDNSLIGIKNDTYYISVVEEDGEVKLKKIKWRVICSDLTSEEEKIIDGSDVDMIGSTITHGFDETIKIENVYIKKDS